LSIVVYDHQYGILNDGTQMAAWPAAPGQFGTVTLAAMLMLAAMGGSSSSAAARANSNTLIQVGGSDTSIPSLSPWALAVLAFLLGLAGVRAARCPR
jgi:hypothetical protein